MRTNKKPQQGWLNCFNLSCCLLAVFVLFPGVASAHPVPRAEYDRNITVVVEPHTVVVTYRLELDPFTLFHDVGRNDSGFTLDKNRKLVLDDFAKAFIERMQVVIPDHLVGSLNGEPLKFEVLKARYSQPDSVQFLFEFRAKIAPRDDANQFEFEEINFPDKKGTLKLTFDTTQSVNFTEFYEPSERKSEIVEDRKQRSLSATFQSPGLAEIVESQPGVVTEGTTPAERGSLLHRLAREGLWVLMESSVSLPLLLILSFFFGAAHALTPGHGKTLVAAYLIGEKGTTWHAIFLGVVTTLAHTGSVILIALSLWIWYPDTDRESVRKTLGMVGGLMIVMLGIWILFSRLAGKSDHIHLTGHAHGHAHGSEAEHSHSHGITPETNWKQMLILGIQGGIVPCWDAVLLLGIAISTDQVHRAVPLLLAFSTGLATTLVAVGIAVIRANRYGNGHWQERWWMKSLPILSAVIVIIIGISLCAGSR